MQPLRGLRVLDLGDEVASRAARLLADLGAEVEAVDPATAPSAGAVRRADVLLQSAATGPDPRPRADPAALAALNRQLVSVTVSGFGSGGPHGDAASCDLVLVAAGGLLALCGEPDAPPVRPHGRTAYHAAALSAAVAALLGLARRRRIGRGAAIELSAQEAVASMLEHALVNHLAGGAVAKRQGGLAWNGSSFILPCRDGHIVATAATQWQTLVEWVAADGAAGDLAEPRWQDPVLRRREVAHLVDMLGRWSRRHAVDELFETAQALRLPWAPVRTPQQVAQCPQLAARGFRGRPYRLAAAPRMAPPRPQAGCGATALHGLRVLDFSWVLAGPYATRLLADFGADVVKVQSARTGANASPDPYHEAWNRNKRSLAIDMTQPQARGLVLDLVRQCDVLVQNFAPRVMANWGLDAATLHDANPRLVVLGISAMGRSGPWRDHVGFGPGLQALSGMTHACSADPARPTGLGHAHADHLMGLFGALAVLAALQARARSGRGTDIDLSGLEAMATLATEPAAGPEGEPEGIYRCRGDDRWCVLSVRGDAQWHRFAGAVGAAGSDWTLDPAFATAAGRRHGRARLDACVQRWTGTLACDDVVTRLRAVGLAAAPVQHVDELVVDPQLRRRGFFAEVDAGPRGRIRIDRSPIRFVDDERVRFTAAPALGADGQRVLGDWLGLDAAAVARLQAAGVLR
jgi:crotonobetainyl-CoA:carnitine CoA-transferase CaiB-like acyl-CoA transferase